MSEELETLGSGNFGSVYLKKINGVDYAIKIIDMRNNAKSAISEAAILLYLSGVQGVLQIKSFTVKDNNMMIATELGEGTIDKIPVDFIKFNLRIITYQLVQGLYNIHMKGVLHRDIKPQNVFYNLKPDLRIFYGDFGIARLGVCNKPFKLLDKAYSLDCRAPEFLKEEFTFDYGSKADIWALGVTLFYLVTGDYPFVIKWKGSEEGFEREMEELIKEKLSDDIFWMQLTSVSSIGFTKLIKKMLVFDQEERSSTTLLLKDNYLSVKGNKPLDSCRDSFGDRVFKYKQVTQVSKNRIEAINRLIYKYESLLLGMDTLFLALCYFDLLTQGESVSNSVILMNICLYIAICIEELESYPIELIFSVKGTMDMKDLDDSTIDLFNKTVMALDKYLYTVTIHHYIILDKYIKEKNIVMLYSLLLRLAYPNTFYHPRILIDVACYIAKISSNADHKIEKAMRENFSKFYSVAKKSGEFLNHLKGLGIHESHLRDILPKK